MREKQYDSFSYTRDGYDAYGRFNPYRDIDGRPVERTPETHRYSFSDYVVFKDEAGYRLATGSAYSDRMQTWDYDKYKSAAIAVWGENRQGGGFPSCPNSGKDANTEKFLRLYYDDPQLELVAIIASCNVSSGYPLWALVWIPGNKTEESAQ